MGKLRGLVLASGLAAAALLALLVLAPQSLPGPLRSGTQEGVAWVDSLHVPAVPQLAAPAPPKDGLQVHVLDAAEQVLALTSALGPEYVLHRQPGGVVLSDGRLYVADANRVAPLLARLGWESLPLQVSSIHELPSRIAVPAAASAGWRWHVRAFLAAQDLRDALQRTLSWWLAGFGMFALVCVAWSGRGLRRSRPSSVLVERAHSDAASGGGASPVRVVLVRDHAALENARTAIGEEYVIGATRDAFAFAQGWILAVREGTVFELVSRLGWSERAVRVFSHLDAMGGGVPAVPDDWTPERRTPRGEAMQLVDVLRLCGPIAHAGDRSIPI